MRVVAGPIPSAANLLRSLDPETAERVNWVNARFIEAARKARHEAEGAALIQRHHPPVNIARAPTVDLSKPASADVLPAEAATLIASIPEDLSIPDFLKRTVPAAPRAVPVN